MTTYLTNRLIEVARKSSILVTGSSGYLGNELSRQLRTARIPFTAVDKEPSRAPEEETALNLSSEAATLSLFQEASPDTIIHCGTHSALAYQNDFISSFREDLLAISNILEGLSENRDARLIFFSSSYVYSGLDPEQTVDETTRTDPSHNFGVAKLFFEQYVLRNHPNSVVFRLSSVFGNGQQQHPNAIANMALECLANKQLAVWGQGKRRMQYIYLKEVVLSTFEAIKLSPDLYNLGGEDYTSVAFTAKQIGRFYGAELEFLSEKKEGETLPFMRTKKLRSAAKDYRSYPFSDALDEYLSQISS